MQPGDQDHLVHVVQVPQRDDFLQPEEAAGGMSQRDHHGEAAENGARHEIRREDRRVPAGEMDMAKSKLTTLWTESTSGVDSAAKSR